MSNPILNNDQTSWLTCWRRRRSEWRKLVNSLSSWDNALHQVPGERAIVRGKYLFWSYCPCSFLHFARNTTLKLQEVSTRNVVGSLISLHRCSLHKNCNSALPNFGVNALRSFFHFKLCPRYNSETTKRIRKKLCRLYAEFSKHFSDNLLLFVQNLFREHHPVWPALVVKLNWHCPIISHQDWQFGKMYYG